MPAPASATRIGVERRAIVLSSEAKETDRVPPEHAVEIGAGEPLLDGLEGGRVSHGPIHVDEGPIGAPDAVLDAEGFDHRTREWLHVVVAGIAGDPEWRRELDGRVPLAAEAQHRLKPWLIEAGREIPHAEMIDQDLDAALTEDRRDLRPLGVVGEDLGVPVEGLQAGKEAHRLGPREPVALVGRKVEAHAYDAAARQLLQPALRRQRIENRDALEAPGIACDGVEHRRIVGAIAARLHQKRVPDAVTVEHAAVGFLRAVLMRPRLVAGPVGERKPGGVDDMGVAVDRARGRHAAQDLRRGMARVDAASNRWIRDVSSAIVVRSPGASLVCRPTRAMNSCASSALASTSRVSAPKGSTAMTRTAISAMGPRPGGAGSS